jgi:RHS repeat-associated protein
MQYFENLFETEQEDDFMNVTPNTPGKVENARNASYLYWNDTPGTTKEEKAVGPSIGLKVNAGDNISLKAWTRFEEKTSYARDFNIAALASLLGNTFATSQGFEGYTIPDATDNLLGALTAAGYGNDTENTTPFAYLNYIIYDENMAVVNGDAVRVPAEAGSETSSLNLQGNEPVKLEFPERIFIPQNGYIYIWVSNESKNTRVWFDDLTVTHVQNMVVQASDYGVWGDVLREQLTDAKKYRFGYQGQFAEKDAETGWNHFELREYDAIIGRWTSVDPASQYFSPYEAQGNNPICRTDPDGGKDGPGDGDWGPSPESLQFALDLAKFRVAAGPSPTGFAFDGGKDTWEKTLTNPRYLQALR